MKSNLPSEHKQMHKFTEVANGEGETNFMSLTTLFVRMISYEVMKSNLPAKEKWIHKFTKVASGEREKQNSCHSPYCLSEW